jgi:hypothetical protein
VISGRHDNNVPMQDVNENRYSGRRLGVTSRMDIGGGGHDAVDDGCSTWSLQCVRGYHVGDVGWFCMRSS